MDSTGQSGDGGAEWWRGMSDHPLFKRFTTAEQWEMSGMGKEEHKAPTHKMQCESCTAQYTPGSPAMSMHKKSTGHSGFKRVKYAG